MKWTHFSIKNFGYLLSSLWRLWFLTVFLIVFIILIPPLFFFTQIYTDQKIVCNIARLWSRLTLFFSGVFLNVKYEEEINRNENYIICPNHISTIDIPVVLAALNFPIIFMAKKEYTKIPIFGWFYKNNTVIVNRENNKDAYGAFVSANEKLNNGLNVCIFPEGGVPPPEVKLRRFKNGPFKLAIESNTKIIPVTMPNNKSCFPWNYFRGRPGRLNVEVHAPISQKQETNDIKNLNTTVYNIIFDKLSDYEN